jgi:hypothetical protein
MVFTLEHSHDDSTTTSWDSKTIHTKYGPLTVKRLDYLNRHYKQNHISNYAAAAQCHPQNVSLCGLAVHLVHHTNPSFEYIYPVEELMVTHPELGYLVIRTNKSTWRQPTALTFYTCSA